MTGLWTGWYEDGHQKYAIQYKNGKMNGSYTYYWEETKHKSKEGHYKDNLKHGSWKDFAQNGKVFAQGKYAYDKKQGKWTFYNVQEVKVREQNFKDDVAEGKFTEYYENGKKHYTGAFKNRLKEGTWTYWKPNGEVYQVIRYSNGQEIQ